MSGIFVKIMYVCLLSYGISWFIADMFQCEITYILIVCLLITIFCIYKLEDTNKKELINENNYKISNIEKNYNSAKQNLEKQFYSDKQKLEKDLQEKEDNLLAYIKDKEDFYKEVNKDIKQSMHFIAEYIADMDIAEYTRSENYLKIKPRPAIKEALRIDELKKQTKEYITQYKMMKYEYDYLFSVFPELENYIEFNFDYSNIKELKDNYDYTRNWVSQEEYEQMPENARNQLALDRYIESKKKSKWQIGRDYEMYIGYLFGKQGYNVKYTGILEQLNDLGRDLIATKGNETLIIQCKNWASNKTIHEKHINQLFGTTVQYNIQNRTNAQAVFVTSTQVSDMAQEFANYLGVQVEQNIKLKEFPRIKCNINNGEKIYHLPFDQQYDRTIIDKKGEFFAWNVEEATNAGFRRAKRYFYSDIN